MHARLSQVTGRTALVTSILAGVIGAITAVGCVSFHLLIEWFVQLFWGVGSDDSFLSTLATLSSVERVFIPTLGGFFVGVLYTLVRLPEVEGEGVPAVLKAVTSHQSMIRFFIAPLKILATALTLATGGSAGREGPIVQIGSAIGSSIAKLTRQNEHTTRLLLAAGAAAGIGGTFGAPLAGVLFSLEIILRTRAVYTGYVLLLAALVAHALTSSALGFSGLRLPLSESFLLTPALFLSSLFIGVVAGAVSVTLRYSILFAERLFRRITVHRVVVTTTGGLCIGGIGLFFPFVHEPATYSLLTDLLTEASVSFEFLLLLLLLKIIATAITLGSGGSGGVLAPALLTGLTLGLLLVTPASLVGIDIAHSAVVFGLIGMAAVFAGVTHAPLTASILLYEITQEPLVFVLVLGSSVVAYYVARSLHKESIYTRASM